MDKSQVMEHVKGLLHRKFQIDPERLTAGTRQEELGIDSILMVDLMLEIETELDFVFNSMDLQKNPSLDEICGLILANMPR